MKNVTLGADAGLIKKAQAAARAQHKTLDAALPEWLQQSPAQSGSALDMHHMPVVLSCSWTVIT
jgi:hypothetical protein